MRNSKYHEARSPGFTLVEALAVVFIVGLLSALLIPAVQSSREAARRSLCRAALRQIGLAVSLYDAAEQCVPPAALLKPGVPGVSGSADYNGWHSPMTRVLPYLEQNVLFNQMNFDFDATSISGTLANYTAARTALDAALCPSDSVSAVLGRGGMSYRFASGTAVSLFVDPVLDRPPFHGPFACWGRVLRHSDLVDGAFCTAAASERLMGDWTQGVFKAGGDVVISQQLPPVRHAFADDALQICGSLDPASVPHDSRGGRSWALTGYNNSSFNSCNGPNGWRASCGFHPPSSVPLAEALQLGTFPATSNHPGGVNVLMMDGSVKFAKDSIALPVWRGLATCQGGEVVSMD